jgi:hypothetical protein
MAVNRMCSEIVEKVNLSGLDFKINQMPYSLHLSIRKKFSKTPNTNSNSSAISYDDPLQNEYL